MVITVPCDYVHCNNHPGCNKTGGYCYNFETLTLGQSSRGTRGRMKENPMTRVYLILLFLLYAHLSICNGLVSVSVVGLNSVKGNEIKTIPRRDCGAEMGQCLGEEMDWEMESDSRRVLMVPKRYISYETLKRDMIPCARPGASYYNCRDTGEANPYTRGCEVITGCARGVRDIKT